MESEEKYRQQRRKACRQDIESATKENALHVLLCSRKQLAEIYEDDGAKFTAQSIRSVDIPMIENAILAAKS
jgi:hypothetical protein